MVPRGYAPIASDEAGIGRPRVSYSQGHPSDEAGIGRPRVSYSQGHPSDEAGIGRPCVSYSQGHPSRARDFADGRSDEEEETGNREIGIERHVHGPRGAQSPPLRGVSSPPLKGPHSSQPESKPPVPRLSTVPETSEEAVLACRKSESCRIDDGNRGNEDQGVGSDGTPNAQSAADTLSQHSNDSCGITGPFDSAGSRLLKRKAAFVSREDSGVCMKRQSSGYSGGDDAGVSVTGHTSGWLISSPVITGIGSQGK